MAAIEDLAGASIVLDGKLRVVEATASAEELIGTRLPTGENAAKLICGGASNRPIAEALAKGFPVTGTVERPHRGGEIRTVVVRATPIERRGARLGWVLALEAPAPPEHGGGGPVLFHGLWTSDPSMKRAFHVVERAAGRDATVLVRGETGTGKELVARAIHEHSARAEGPFVTVNTAAIPRELVESELYGHEKGAFTSATARHEGRFEQADGGTLFLDEIGELPLDAQAKLLRAIQERRIDRVGGRSRAVDVRLVAATNADLAGLVESGAFRADLYWRLSVLVLRIPPLRERPEDLEPLAAHFLAKHAPALVGRSITLGEGAERALRAHAWPGNVRELENAVQRALVSCTGDALSGDALEVAIRAVASPGGSGGAGLPIDDVPDGRAYAEVMERAERRILEAAMTRFGGNQVQAARWLGIHRNTLRTRLAALGLSPRDEV